MKSDLLILILILTLGFSLRAWNLGEIPYWHWDEGVNMNISWNLIHGKFQWFSLSYPFVPHPPLYFIVSGILLVIFGNELIVLRALSVLYGMGTILLVYLIGKDILGSRIALLPAFLLSVYPVAIYWGRMAFANNQLMFLSILVLFSFHRYLKEGGIWFYLLAIGTGLAMITEFLGISLFISILVLFWIYDRERLWKVLILSSSPFFLYIAIMLLLMPEAFIHDLLFLVERVGMTPARVLSLIVGVSLAYAFRKSISGLLLWLGDLYLEIMYDAVSIFDKIDEKTKRERLWRNGMLLLALLNFLLAITLINPLSDTFLLESFDYFWLGIMGLFLISDKIPLIFFLPLFTMILLLGRTDHMLIPLYPLFCLGLTEYLKRIYGFLISLSRWRFIPILTVILLLYPSVFLVYQDISGFVLGNTLIRENISVRNKVADFVNENLQSKDFVLADSHLPRFIRGNSSVLLQGIAIEGKAIAYMAPDYGKERFKFNCFWRKASFIILTEKGMEFLRENEKEVMDEIENWSRVDIHSYRVYKNPASENNVGGEPYPKN